MVNFDFPKAQFLLGFLFPGRDKKLGEKTDFSRFALTDLYFGWMCVGSTTRELGCWRCGCDVRTLGKISDIFAIISGFRTGLQ